jgi:phosphate uptake regulator
MFAVSESLRKVQRVGESTFVVSLPRPWVVERRLHKGELVSIVEEEDGSIRIRASTAKSGERHLRYRILADRCPKLGFVVRLAASAYIRGAESCTIIWRSSATLEQLEKLRRISKKLIGVNIVEETPNKVVLQSFVDPLTYPVDGLLQRVFIVESEMMEALARELEQNSTNALQDISNFEDEIDSLTLMILRQLTLASDDRVVARMLGIPSVSALLTCQLVTKVLEGIGDLLENLLKEIVLVRKAHLSQGGMGLEVNRRQLQSLTEILRLLSHAYFTEDIMCSNQVIELSQELASSESDLMRNIFEKMKTESLTESLVEYRVFSTVKEIADSFRIIAEAIIDRRIRASPTSDALPIQEVAPQIQTFDTEEPAAKFNPVM